MALEPSIVFALMVDLWGKEQFHVPLLLPSVLEKPKEIGRGCVVGKQV